MGIAVDSSTRSRVITIFFDFEVPETPLVGDTLSRRCCVLYTIALRPNPADRLPPSRFQNDCKVPKNENVLVIFQRRESLLRTLPKLLNSDPLIVGSNPRWIAEQTLDAAHLHGDCVVG